MQKYNSKTIHQYNNTKNTKTQLNMASFLSDSILGDEIAPCCCSQGTAYQTLQTCGGELFLIFW